MSRRGFTLIEIMLALAIFSLIGITTVKQIVQIRTTKDTALNDLEIYNEVRTALSLVRYDLNQAFHILFDDLGEVNKRAVLANQPVPHTLFDGRKKELVFTSLSHRVYYAGLRECEQTEISFFLQASERGQKPSLMKRESPIIDADLYQGGGVYTILDNVTLLEFQYWNPKRGVWVDDWNSDDGEFRDKFPMAVKMKMVVSPEGKPDFPVEAEFKLAFPNNEKFLVEFN